MKDTAMTKDKKAKDDSRRSALAAAIEAAEQEQRRSEVVIAGITRARTIVAEASAKLEAQRAAVEAAKEARTFAVAVAAAAEGGGTLLADPTLRDARAAELEAADEMEAARAALAKLQAQFDPSEKDFLGRPADPLSRARRAVEAEVDEVFRQTSIDAFVAETAALQRDLVGRRQVLAWLMRSDLLGAGTDQEALGRLMKDSRLPEWWDKPGGAGCGFNINDDHPACAPWKAAREALKSDPHAELPL